MPASALSALATTGDPTPAATPATTTTPHTPTIAARARRSLRRARMVATAMNSARLSRARAIARAQSVAGATMRKTRATVVAVREVIAWEAPGPALAMAGGFLLASDLLREEIRRILAGRRLAAGEDHDLITMCYNSSDFREGIDAFLAKRAPTWTGN